MTHSALEGGGAGRGVWAGQGRGQQQGGSQGHRLGQNSKYIIFDRCSGKGRNPKPQNREKTEGFGGSSSVQEEVHISKKEAVLMVASLANLSPGRYKLREK